MFAISGCELANSNIGGGSSQSTARISKNGSSLGYSPDLTSGVHHGTASTVCYDYTYSDKNSNCSSLQKTHGINGMSTPIHMAPFADFRPISEHYYEQPMVVFPSTQQQQTKQHSPDSHEKTPFFNASADQRSSSSSGKD